jgi:hypothetical protein
LRHWCQQNKQKQSQRKTMNLLLTRNAVDVFRRFEVDMERLEARPVAST